MVGKTRRTAKKRGRTGARPRQTSKSRATRRGKKVSVSANMSQETPEEDVDVLGAIPEEETERPLRRSRRTATGEESEQKRPRYREYSSGEDEDEGVPVGVSLATREVTRSVRVSANESIFELSASAR